MRIADMPQTERPRERLLRQGPEGLSDGELLAIFLRTGRPGCGVMELARQLLEDFGGLRALLEADADTLCRHRGVGPAKYAQLAACLEMARRHLRARLDRADPLTSPELVREYLRAQLRDHPHEVFCALFLDNRHRVVAFEKLFHGTIDGASVHPRVVAVRALALNAAALIVAHNHPSGLATPSECDVRMTRRLKDALALLDIRLLDHFIVGDGEVVSMAERGQL